MDRYIVFLGLISCIIAGSLAAETVEVGSDIEVKPTQSPLLDPSKKVNATLNCTGSKSDLSYYIKNRVIWSFKDSKGKKYNLTEAFYQDPNSDYAAKHFKAGHMAFKYLQDVTNRYVFSLSLMGVNRSDNGIYRCSLLNESGHVIDKKDLKLTVVNPVEKVSIEIHNANHQVITRSSKPVSKRTEAVKITPGQYMVMCNAGGSNPEPVMNLYLNDQMPYVSVKNSRDSTSDLASYKGSFTVDSLAINAHSALQSLVCKANIPGDYYQSVEAGIALMVQIDKPTIKCSNFTASLGDKQRKVNCNVTAGENSAALKCDKLSWYLSVKAQWINAVQRWKDLTKEYDMIESTCDETSKGVQIQLMLYLVKPKLFKEAFFLVYGQGDNAHREPVPLYDVTVAAAGIVTPLSLLACLIMAFVSSRLARL